VKKLILSSALLIGLGAVALQWLQYQYVIRLLSPEVYIVVIAAGFTVLGAWVGHRITRRPADPDAGRNQQALDALKISDSEYRVLELLVAGHSNKEIADRLCLSVNTVKTHLAHLYAKLDVSRRTQAVRRARELRLVV
jgi:DNA-binding NarL/FixJ family response regulator